MESYWVDCQLSLLVHLEGKGYTHEDVMNEAAEILSPVLQDLNAAGYKFYWSVDAVEQEE